MLEGVKVDGRQFRKPGCQHVWVDTHTNETHNFSLCALCKRTKKRRVTVSKRAYKSRPGGIGVNIAGVPFHRNKYPQPLPVVFRGLSRA